MFPGVVTAVESLLCTCNVFLFSAGSVTDRPPGPPHSGRKGEQRSAVGCVCACKGLFLFVCKRQKESMSSKCLVRRSCSCAKSALVQSAKGQDCTLTCHVKRIRTTSLQHFFACLHDARLFKRVYQYYSSTEAEVHLYGIPSVASVTVMDATNTPWFYP